MSFDNCDPKKMYAIIIAQLGFMLVEYWLGRTGKVKSGSLLELVIIVPIVAIFIWTVTLLKGKQDGKNGNSRS